MRHHFMYHPHTTPVYIQPSNSTPTGKIKWGSGGHMVPCFQQDCTTHMYVMLNSKWYTLHTTGWYAFFVSFPGLIPRLFRT